MLADGGSVVIDELVEVVFTVPTPVGEHRPSGWSVVSCLPSAMDDPETAATGAVMRPTVPAALSEEAGFGDLEILPIETDFWRFYRLRP
jgi:hypothetical protein